MGLSWIVIFALLTAWSYFRGHRPAFLLLWAVMLGIFLGGTTLGRLGSHTVTTALTAVGSAVVTSLNAVAR